MHVSIPAMIEIELVYRFRIVHSLAMARPRADIARIGTYARQESRPEICRNEIDRDPQGVCRSYRLPPRRVAPVSCRGHPRALEVAGEVAASERDRRRGRAKNRQAGAGSGVRKL
jgi:hypothetical protein